MIFGSFLNLKWIFAAKTYNNPNNRKTPTKFVDNCLLENQKSHKRFKNHERPPQMCAFSTFIKSHICPQKSKMVLQKSIWIFDLFYPRMSHRGSIGPWLYSDWGVASSSDRHKKWDPFPWFMVQLYSVPIKLFFAQFFSWILA